jgi:L-asparaginase
MVIVVVSTGGTIASTESSAGDASPDLTAADLVEAVPGLNNVANVWTHDFSNMPSPHFMLEKMFDLLQVCAEYDDNPDVEGVVITQGTDILEESAYFLDLTYSGETPVVVTGAMRNPSLASPDGPGNLLASIRVAASEDARGRGVLVALNDRVLAARDATKTNSMHLDSFRAPEFGPLATVDESRVIWHHNLADGRPVLDVDTDALTNDVHAVTATADMPPAQVEAAGDAAALCLATTGAGHIPPMIIPALEGLRDADIPLVATSRCPEGRLARETYGFRGSEATLRELGMYYSSQNLQKTRIATIVGLAADALDELFDRASK